jgi:hypothetical protein
VAPTSPRTVYVTDVGTFQGLYVSHDGGLHFDQRAAAPQFPDGVFPHSTQDGLLFVSADNALYRSANGGATFTKVLDQPVSDLQFDPLDASIVYVAAGSAGLFRSRDFGATFAPFGNLSANQLGAGAHAIGVQADERRRTYYLNTGRGISARTTGARPSRPSTAATAAAR